MQRVTPQAASRTPVVRSVVFFVLACATMLSWNGRPAKAADVDMQVDDAARRCAALGAMKVPASAFALPTGSAAVTEALLIAPESTNPTLEYCRVRATIAAAQASDPSILYQITAQSMELQNGPTRRRRPQRRADRSDRRVQALSTFMIGVLSSAFFSNTKSMKQTWPRMFGYSNTAIFTLAK